MKLRRLQDMKEKINKYMENNQPEINNTIYQINISIESLVSRVEQVKNRSYFRRKNSLNKLKKIKITPCIILDDNGIKLDLINKRNLRKYSNTQHMETEQHTAKRTLSD
jgi:hypothetical protein